MSGTHEPADNEFILLSRKKLELENEHLRVVTHKAEVEQRKLEAEIRETNRRWWANPALYAGYVSAVAALFIAVIQFQKTDWEAREANINRLRAELRLESVNQLVAVQQSEYDKLLALNNAFRNAVVPTATNSTSAVAVRCVVRSHKDKSAVADVQVTVLETDNATNVLAKTVSNDVGEFLLRLEPGKRVTVFLLRDGFQAAEHLFEVKTGASRKEFDLIEIKSIFDEDWYTDGIKSDLLKKLSK